MSSRRTELSDDAEKAIFMLRVLQVMPTEERWAIDLKEVMARLIENFSIKDDSKLKTRVSYQLKNLQAYELLIESDENKRHWYRNTSVDLDLSAPDLDTLSTLSILAKIADKLFKHSSEPIKKHLEQLTKRFDTITHFEQTDRLAKRFEYADFLLQPDFDTQHYKASLATIQKALVEDCVVSVLYRPRDKERLKVDVGLPLGIVQKANLQTLVLLARKTNGKNPSADTLRIGIDRIVFVHLRQQKGQLERFSSNVDTPSEIWHLEQNQPESQFEQFLESTGRGMVVRRPLEEILDEPTRTGETPEHEAGDGTDEKGQVKLVAHVHSHLKTHLDTLKLSPDQHFTKLTNPPHYEGTAPGDDWFELTATVVPSENLEWWIMSWAERIVLCQPTNMTKRISHRIKRAAANYGKHG